MDEQQKQQKCQYPPAEFWRALLALRNHAFIKLKDDYFKAWGVFPKEGSFQHSVDLVDCYLDHALNDGWMDD
jgi:hypothetical protein